MGVESYINVFVGVHFLSPVHTPLMQDILFSHNAQCDRQTGSQMALWCQ